MLKSCDEAIAALFKNSNIRTHSPCPGRFSGMPLTSWPIKTSGSDSPWYPVASRSPKFITPPFGAHLIGIAPDYRLHVSDRLLAQNDGPMLEALKRLHGNTIHLPSRAKDLPRPRQTCYAL